MSYALPASMPRFDRYSKPAAERKLSDALGLAWDQQMQDWDLTNADAALVPSLFPLLERNELSDDERFSAMALTVASVDELFLTHGIQQEVWKELEAMLLGDPALHASTIWYWAQPSLNNEEEPFPISPCMAELWRRVEPRLISNAELLPTHFDPR